VARTKERWEGSWGKLSFREKIRSWYSVKKNYNERHQVVNEIRIHFNVCTYVKITGLFTPLHSVSNALPSGEGKNVRGVGTERIGEGKCGEGRSKEGKKRR